MARRLWETMGRLVLIMAALIVDLLAPSGSAADIPQDLRDACEKEGIPGNRDAGPHMLYCASHAQEGFGTCCHFLTVFLSNKTDNCTCGGFKVIADRGIDINKECNTTAVIGDKCRAQEEEAPGQEEEKEEQEEEELSKIEPCNRFFKRVAGVEVSMATLQDAVACIHAMKKRPANCQKLQ
jgi:hypothetical protein